MATQSHRYDYVWMRYMPYQTQSLLTHFSSTLIGLLSCQELQRQKHPEVHVMVYAVNAEHSYMYKQEYKCISR
jgi:hypothetical protein